jgi:hypothetical protein
VKGRVIRPSPLFNLGALASVLFVLRMTLIPILERLFLRDLIRLGDEKRQLQQIITRWPTLIGS